MFLIDKIKYWLDKPNREHKQMVKNIESITLIQCKRTFWKSQPLDIEHRYLFLDDTVLWRGESWQVVAMSHKNKVALRKPGDTRGAKWVKANGCTLVRHAGKWEDWK